MSAYEIYLLIGSFFGALCIISVASALLNEGSARTTALLVLLTCGFIYMAKQNTEGAVALNDIPPAINKLIGIILS